MYVIFVSLHFLCGLRVVNFHLGWKGLYEKKKYILCTLTFSSRPLRRLLLMALKIRQQQHFCSISL